MTDREFLGLLRDEHRGVLVRLSLVDVAGDFLAGALLSQILYWYATARDGRPRGSVVRDGRVWLVRRREDWFREIRLRPAQVDRAVRILSETGCVATAVWKHNGNPTTHICPDIPAIARSYGLAISKSRIGDNEITDPAEPWKSPNGDFEITNPEEHPSETVPEDHEDFSEEPLATNGAETGLTMADIPESLAERAIEGLRLRGIPVRNPNSPAGAAMIVGEVRRMMEAGE